MPAFRGWGFCAMPAVARAAAILFSIALSCAAGRDAHPNGSAPFGSQADRDVGAAAAADHVTSEHDSNNRAAGVAEQAVAARGERLAALYPAPLPPQRGSAMPYELAALSERWSGLLTRVRRESQTLAACHSGERPCPDAARRFLSIIELGLRRQGRARLGEINRAINLSIRPASDWSLYGVEDFWSAPIATLNLGAGDCEDYAIAKYVALREAGVPPGDLRLLIVRDVKRGTNHAVVAARLENEWLLLDNRTLIIVNADEATHYVPLFLLDDRGVRMFRSVASRD